MEETTMTNTNMQGGASTVSESDKTTAGYITSAAAGVLVFFALIAALLGGFVWAVIDLALAGAIGFFGYMKLREGNLQLAKNASLIVGGIVILLGLVSLSMATAGGGLGFLIALIVLGTGGGLIYAAMLLSPGRKLF
jgi:hypothetical protein